MRRVNSFNNTLSAHSDWINAARLPRVDYLWLMISFFQIMHAPSHDCLYLASRCDKYYIFFSVVLDRVYSEFHKGLYCILACDSEEDLILFEEFRSGLLWQHKFLLSLGISAGISVWCSKQRIVTDSILNSLWKHVILLVMGLFCIYIAQALGMRDICMLFKALCH